MRNFGLLIAGLTAILISIPPGLHSEGSKQLNTSCMALTTRLYLCNDFNSHCDYSGGIRSQFAVYNASQSAPDDAKLYFVTRANEVVYMGFNGDPSGTSPPLYIVYRICDSTGAVVFGESNLPKFSTGFIPTIIQACEGPKQLLPAPANAGYDAIVWTPPGPGTYYIEFSEKDDNGYYTGVFTMELFDITVFNTVTASVKPGRLYCKSWQLAELNNFTGINYILSDDGIVTSIEFNSMKGGSWIQYANQTGCGNTNWLTDRKSLFNRQAVFPQYKVFLNSPDPRIFQIATSLGKIIPPDPTGFRSCDGTVAFMVNVDKAGNVQIELGFTPSNYINRVLNQAVTPGSNTIHWDGKDGSGVEVANNVIVSLAVTYINGLTNLPLYDVEGSENGIFVALVSPPGIPPRVYWDDSDIWDATCLGCDAGYGPNSLDVKSNVSTGGCPPPTVYPPGCHKWPAGVDGWGNLNTINSWWYTVSTSTTYPSITEWRSPKPLLFHGGPMTVCAGSQVVGIAVDPDPNTEEYHWEYTGTGVTFQPSAVTTTPFVKVDFSLTATDGNLTVYGTNANCSNTPSPVISLPVSITAVLVPPDLGPDRTLCKGPEAFLDAGPGYIGYFWSTGDTSRMIHLGNSGKYWVRVRQSGCTGSDTVTITLLPLTPTSLKPDTAICDGQTYILDPGKDFTSVLWSTGDNSATLKISKAGRYWVHTVDRNNCPGSDTVKIALKPAIPVNLARDTSLCSGTSIILDVSVTGATYLWQDGSRESHLRVSQPGTYWVRVSRDSCAVLDTSSVLNCTGGVTFPSAFAPGSIVGNNYFHPLGPVLSKFSLTIFNRSGQQVFTTDNQETGWDGTFRGSQCPADIYVYTVIYELEGSPGKTYKIKGTISLVR